MSQQKKAQPKVDAKIAREMLWRKGHLSWMLDDNQKELYKIFHETNHKVQTWLLSRRSGKTYMLCILALELAIRQPNAIIKFLSPTKKQVERNLRPLFNQILETCPEDVKPVLKQKDDIYYFANGSEIQMAGSEAGNIDTLRGGSSHICIIDEGQDVSNLHYAVKSVLGPTTVTTKGKILLAGTPPKDQDHEFLDYVEMAEANGILRVKTIYDNPRLSKEDIEEQIKLSGGENSEDFQREFMCKIFKSKTNTVIPEFDDEKIQELVKPWKKPAFYDSYIGMDLGFRDMTVVLFAYYDFLNDKVVIERELVKHGEQMHLQTLGQEILDIERELWTSEYGDVVKPRKRVSDHDLIAINEIHKATHYQLRFDLADKKEMMSGINFIRNMINNNKIIINHECKTTIYHLKAAKWVTQSKDKLGRGQDGSHFDSVAALSYLLRAIDFSRNPYPKNYNRPTNPDDIFVMNNKKPIEKENVYRKILNLKKRQ